MPAPINPIPYQHFVDAVDALNRCKTSKAELIMALRALRRAVAALPNEVWTHELAMANLAARKAIQKAGGLP